MPDQPDVQPIVDPGQELQTQIASSLASVWARYVGARPTSASTEVEGNVVRWVLTGGTTEFADGMATEPAEGEAPKPLRTVTGYERETSSAVAKATHRKVVAMISRHDSKTGTATETFILERALKKY